MTCLRNTGNTLKPGKEVVESAEIRSDRMVPGIYEVFQGGGGGVNFELSHLSLHDFFSLALFCNWLTSTVTCAGTELTFATPANTITHSGSPAFTTKYVVGQHIRVTGTTAGTNDGDYTITNVAAAVLTVAESVTGQVGTPGIIRGSIIRNGSVTAGSLLPLVDAKSVILEDHFDDIEQFLAYRGSMLDTLALELNAKQIAKGSMSFVAAGGQRAAVTLGTGAHVAAPTNEVFNCSANVGSLTEGGSALATALQAIRLNLNNKIQARPALGSATAVSLRKGTIGLGGNIDAYFEDGTLFDKFKNHTASSLSVKLTDEDGNSLWLTVPAIRYTGEDVAPQAKDQDVMEKLEFMAARDTTTDCMIQIEELAA
jgi:hypothetical protein